MFEQKKKTCIEAGTFVFFIHPSISFIRSTFVCAKPQTKKCSCATLFLPKQLFGTSIVPSAKLLWRKTEIFMHCFPYMQYFWLFHDVFCRKEKQKNRCLLHIKTAVRDQTSAVFAFFFVFASSPFEDNDNIYMSTATRNMHV